MAAKKTKPRKPTAWRQFRAAYERHLSPLAASSQDQWWRVAEGFERVCKPKLLEDVSRDDVLLYAGYLRDNYKPSSQKQYLRVLKSALKWAHEEGLLKEPVRYKAAKLVSGGTTIPSRAVTDAELELILGVIPDIRRRNGDAPLWVRLIAAMNWADLRVSEILRLSWEPEANVRLLETDSGRPMIHFCEKRSQKAWKPAAHPISKQFWEIASTDTEGKHLVDPEGYCFPMFGFGEPHRQRARNDVGNIIKRFVSAADVVTNEFTSQLAGTHDIGRKAYIARLMKDRRISPFELRKLVRHSSLETTVKHYDFHNAEELGSKFLGW